MIPPELLATKEPDVIIELVDEIAQHLKTLSELLTRKYLLHSGQPRQITSDLGLSP